MKVKALVAHMNGYGDKVEKAVGDEYEVPFDHAAPLIAAGIAVTVDSPPAKDKRLGAKN